MCLRGGSSEGTVALHESGFRDEERLECVVGHGMFLVEMLLTMG